MSGFIKNPETGRACKVGGIVYKRLLRAGLIDDLHYKDDKIICTIDEKETEEEIEMKKMNLDRHLPKHIQAVKGRGKYKNNIIKKYCRTKTNKKEKKEPETETEQQSSDDDILRDYINKYNDEDDTEETESENSTE